MAGILTQSFEEEAAAAAGKKPQASNEAGRKANFSFIRTLDIVKQNLLDDIS